MRASNSIRFSYAGQTNRKDTTMLWFVPVGAGLVSAGTYLITLIAIYRNMSDPPRREALYVLEL